VHVPMLFLQGTRDALADVRLVQALAKQLGVRATLRLFQDADHSFHLPARTGRTDPEMRTELSGATAAWIDTVSAAAPPGPGVRP
jgi:uncharacterized protein